MDKKYLTNLQASPHVDEGMWDQLQARGNAGLQRYRGYMGTGWKPIDEAKLESLWDSFSKKVRYILRDFYSREVFGNINTNRPQDIATHQSDFNKFAKLARSFKVGPPMGMAEPQMSRVITPRRYDDPTVLKQSGVNQGVNLGEMLKEAGFGKFFLPASIQTAKMSNDTVKLLAAYKNYLKKLYEEFLNDVTKVLKLPNTQFTGRSIVTNKPEWKPTLNQWEELIGVPKSETVPPSGDPSSAKPAPTTTDPSKAPEPPKNSPQNTGGTPQKTSPTDATQSSFGKFQALGDIDIDVIEGVVKTIINRIHSDPRAETEEHRYLSTSIAKWKKIASGEDEKSPSPTYDPSTYNVGNPKVPLKKVTEAGGGDKPKDNEFLYPFAANYRKHTGSFTMRVGTFQLKDKTYDVLWHSFSPGEKGHGHANQILVKIYDPKTKKTHDTISLFFFWDHEIDPREPESDDFSIPKLFMDANPHLGNPFTPEDEQRLKALQEPLHKSLFAVTDRKTLEFKRAMPEIGKKALATLMELHGWEDDVEHETYVLDAIKALLSQGVASPTEAQIIEKALFVKSMDDKTSAKGAIEDATKALIAMYSVGKGGKSPSASTIAGWVKDAAQQLLAAGIEPDVKTLIAKANPPPAPIATPAPSPAPATTPVPPIKPSTTTPTPSATPAVADAPTIDIDGTVSWKGKSYKYPHGLPDTWLNALKTSGQMDKYMAMLKAKKEETEKKKAAKIAAQPKKKGLAEIVNPFDPSNFVL